METIPDAWNNPRGFADPVERRITAAQGFLDLGLFEEAMAELEGVTPTTDEQERCFLRVRTLALGLLGRWAEMTETCRPLLVLEPGRPIWPKWMARALALLGDNRGACDLLRATAARFPMDDLVEYCLACLFVRMGDLAAARGHLHRAMEIKPERRAVALAEPELEPFWQELAEG